MFLEHDQYITGIIRAPNGKPVPNVKVYLPQYKGIYDYSGQDGRYNILVRARTQKEVVVSIEKDGNTETYDRVFLGSEFNIIFKR